MTIEGLLRSQIVGKKLRHVNQYNRQIDLEIEDFKCNIHEYEIEASTQANDWWPQTAESVTFVIYFTDGSSIKVSPSQELILI